MGTPTELGGRTPVGEVGSDGDSPVAVSGSSSSMRSNPMFRPGTDMGGIGLSPSLHSRFFGQIRDCMIENGVSTLTTDRSLQRACKQCGLSPAVVDGSHLRQLMPAIEQAARVMVKDATLTNVLGELRLLSCATPNDIVDETPSSDIVAGTASEDGISVNVGSEDDVMAARSSALEYALEIGFERMMAPRVATIVSELARNIHTHAGSGTIELILLGNGIKIVASDNGPGISDIDNVLDENKGGSLKNGRSVGLRFVRRLADTFDVETVPGEGTIVTITKLKF